MANYDFNLTDPTTLMKDEAATFLVAFNAPFTVDASNPTPPQKNFDFNLITNTYRGWLYGRRPASGSMYPRGVYNY